MIVRKRFTLNYQPISWQCTLNILNDIPPVQSVKKYFNETTHTPDWELVHLAIHPEFCLTDPNGIIPDGNHNADLFNITWTEINNGVRRVILGQGNYGADAYTIETSATDETRGEIRRIKNLSDDEADITLQFDADYLDPNTHTTHHITRSIALKLEEEGQKPPRMELNVPRFMDIDQLHTEGAIITLEPKLYQDDKLEDSPAHRVFNWRKWDSEAGNWVDLFLQGLQGGGYYDGEQDGHYAQQIITSNDPRAAEVVDGDPATGKMRLSADLIEDGARYCVWAFMQPNPSAPPSFNVNGHVAASIDVRFNRVGAEQYDAEIGGTGAAVPPEQTSVFVTARVRDNKGGDVSAADIDRCFKCKWYVGDAATPYAQGREAEIPMPANGNPLPLGLEIESYGAYKVWTDQNGSVITDNLGRYIIIHD